MNEGPGRAYLRVRLDAGGTSAGGRYAPFPALAWRLRAGDIPVNPTCRLRNVSRFKRDVSRIGRRHWKIQTMKD